MSLNSVLMQGVAYALRRLAFQRCGEEVFGWQAVGRITVYMNVLLQPLNDGFLMLADRVRLMRLKVTKWQSSVFYIQSALDAVLQSVSCCVLLTRLIIQPVRFRVMRVGRN